MNVCIACGVEIRYFGVCEHCYEPKEEPKYEWPVLERTDY